MAEKVFKSIKAELIWRNRWDTRRQVGGWSCSISTGSAIRAAATHREGAKAPWNASKRPH